MKDFKYINHWENLDFNADKHEYKVLGKKLTPVSDKIKNFYKPFNKEIARYVAMSRQKKTGEKWTKAMVLKEWKEKARLAAENGTRVHDFAENHVNEKYIMEITYIQEPYSDDIQEQGVIDFWKDIDMFMTGYVPVALEQQMYLEEYGIAGTADVILYNKETSKFVIVDYKTNEHLYKDYKDYMFAPFEDMINNNFNKYALQFAHYQLMFEAVGYEVEDRWLIWLQPDDEHSYQLLKVPDLTKKLKEHYESENRPGSHIYFT